MRRACPLAALALAGACLPAVASAAQTTTLRVAFLPNAPGHSTSISFSARITSPDGRAPAPLRELTLSYPNSLGVAVSGLGLTTCERQWLEAIGPAGCPANSLMGRGSVVVAVPFGPETVEEQARMTIVRAPQRREGIALLFYAEGIEPVYADITLTGILAEVGGASEQIQIDVPLVAGLPGGPAAAVVQLHATIGPQGISYLEKVHGRLIPYRPRGILLPARCPREGFRFAGNFDFTDGTRASSLARVACRSPRR